MTRRNFDRFHDSSERAPREDHQLLPDSDDDDDPNAPRTVKHGDIPCCVAVEFFQAMGMEKHQSTFVSV